MDEDEELFDHKDRSVRIGKVMAWQPIETAPRDGTHVLLFSPDAREPFVRVGFFLDGDWWDTWCERRGFPIDADSSHWMPLPEPPHA